MNKENKTKSICTFDFSTLYTKLPHVNFLNVFHKLIDFTFNGREWRFITISIFGKG